MRRGLLAMLFTAATILAVTSAMVAQRSSDEPAADRAVRSAAESPGSPAGAASPQAQTRPSSATPPDPSSPTPHPLNTPSSAPTPEALTPPPVGPYRPRERPDIPPDWQQKVEGLDVLAEIGHENLAAGTRRLVQDLEAGVVAPARATRIALAKLGYLPARGVPERYRGEATQHDQLALSYALELAGLELSDAEADRIAAEVDAYVHGSPEPATP